MTAPDLAGGVAQRPCRRPRLPAWHARPGRDRPEGKVGAIGRVPCFLTHRFPLALVKFGAATAAPARGKDGFRVRCATDEAGEAIGRMREPFAETGGEFEGYTDSGESERKILHDVFVPSDA